MSENREFAKLAADAPEMMRPYTFPRMPNNSSTEAQWYCCWTGFSGDNLLFAIEQVKSKSALTASPSQMKSEDFPVSKAAVDNVPLFNPKGKHLYSLVIPLQLRKLAEGPVLFLHCSANPYIRKALIQGSFAETKDLAANEFLKDIRFAKSAMMLAERFRNRTISDVEALRPQTEPLLCTTVATEVDGTKSTICMWIDLVRDVAKAKLPGFLRIFAGVRDYAGFPAESSDRKWQKLDDAGARYEYELVLPLIGDRAYTKGGRCLAELWTISFTQKMAKIEIVPGMRLLEVIEYLMTKQWLPVYRKTGPLVLLEHQIVPTD